jgi:cellulose synthase/poly-beta-1,6-N-acetylglucosamine synthase-like glycosyltransferase
MVSLQVAAYNEPPHMLIETIMSLEAIDYPNFEVVVIDNNTEDPAVWQPVADYCEGRDRVRFVHVDDWPGYKSGALNLVLTEYTHPDAELIGVIDAATWWTPRTSPRSSATSTIRSSRSSRPRRTTATTRTTGT